MANEFYELSDGDAYETLEATSGSSTLTWKIPYMVFTKPQGPGRAIVRRTIETDRLVSEDGSREWTFLDLYTTQGLWEELDAIVTQLTINGENKGAIVIGSDTDSWGAEGQSTIEVFRAVDTGDKWLNLDTAFGEVADPEEAKSKLLAEIDAQIEALNEAKTVITAYNATKL